MMHYSQVGGYIPTYTQNGGMVDVSRQARVTGETEMRNSLISTHEGSNPSFAKKISPYSGCRIK